MTNEDFNEFKKIWLSAHAKSANGKQLDVDTLSSIFDDLLEYPLSHIKRALQIHAKKSSFAPTVYDVCKIIDANTGKNHPDEDEAWLLAKLSTDETQTVVLTAQILEALDAVGLADAQVGLSEFDRSRAFKAAYSRIIDRTHTPPVWFPSYGTNKAQKLAAVKSAVEKGLLPASQLITPQIEHDARNITTTMDKLIEGAVANAKNPEELRAMWKGLYDSIDAEIAAENAQKTQEAQDRIAAAQAARAAKEEHFSWMAEGVLI